MPRSPVREPIPTFRAAGERQVHPHWDDQENNDFVQTRIWVPEDTDAARTDSLDLPSLGSERGVHVRTHISTESSMTNGHLA